jgi:hypothetical protein
VFTARYLPLKLIINVGFSKYVDRSFGKTNGLIFPPQISDIYQFTCISLQEINKNIQHSHVLFSIFQFRPGSSFPDRFSHAFFILINHPRKQGLHD